MGPDKAWVASAIAHRETEAVPYYFDFTPPARRRAESIYGSPLEERLCLPLRMGSCRKLKPLYADPSEFGPTARDEFGVTWSTSPVDRGAPIRPALSGPDLSGYRFPDPAAAWRFEDIGAWSRRRRSQFTILWLGDLWERAAFMRGLEDLLLDLALHPGFVEELLDGITGYLLDTLGILLERFEFDGVALSDDYGTQRSLLISPESWRRFITPRLDLIYRPARAAGKIIFHHSDGNIWPIIPDLIELGCDILHPVQPEAMDVLRLKREFGRDLTFCGGFPPRTCWSMAAPARCGTRPGG